jgi:hypothetical protein
MRGEHETGVSVIGMTKVIKGGGGVDVGEVWGQEVLVSHFETDI